MWVLTAWNPSLVGFGLVADLGDQPLEMLDRAASAHPRMDRVAPGAKPFVLQLKVELAVEIECRAILVELGPNAPAAGEDEVDLLRARHECPPDGSDRDAFGPLVLDPFDRRCERTGLDGHPQDHLVLDDETGDRLPYDLRLRREQGE